MRLFDSHCDTISRVRDEACDRQKSGALRHNGGQIDLARADEAFEGYAQFFACFADWKLEGRGSFYHVFQEEYKYFIAQMAVNSDLIIHCTTGAQGEAAIGAGKIAAFLSIEGAELLDCDLEKLTEVHRSGVRAINLTWNYANALSGSCAEQPDMGLTDQGRAFVTKMHDLGILVDVSHLSDPGFWDVAELATVRDIPFIASHSNARAVCQNKRNLTDAQFAVIIKRQGVAGINMCDEFLGDTPTIDTLVAHVEHFCALGGAKSIAVGGDWDGCDLFPDIADITEIGKLYEALLRLNYSQQTVDDIFYNNMMRVVNRVCIM